MEQEIDSYKSIIPIREYSEISAFKIFSDYRDIECYLFNENDQKQKNVETQVEIVKKTNNLQEGKSKKILVQEKNIIKYQKAFRGSKNDTVQLNINYKTLLVRYFRQLQQANQLNQYEINEVNQFNQRIPSFNSLLIFFNNKETNKNIKIRALQFISSKDCIKNIMIGRCKMINKLQMIKFIEKLRMNILAQGKKYKWKDIIQKY